MLQCETCWSNRHRATVHKHSGLRQSTIVFSHKLALIDTNEIVNKLKFWTGPQVSNWNFNLKHLTYRLKKPIINLTHSAPSRGVDSCAGGAQWNPDVDRHRPQSEHQDPCSTYVCMWVSSASGSPPTHYHHQLCQSVSGRSTNLKEPSRRWAGGFTHSGHKQVFDSV